MATKKRRRSDPAQHPKKKSGPYTAWKNGGPIDSEKPPKPPAKPQTKQ